MKPTFSKPMFPAITAASFYVSIAIGFSFAQEKASFKAPTRLCTHGTAVSADGRVVAMGGCVGTIAIFDAERGRLHAELKGAPGPVLALSPDGSHLAWVGRRETDVKLWSVKMGRQRAILPHKARPKLVFSPNGKTLATLSDKVRLWDLTTLKPKTLDPYAGDMDAIAFSPDGKRLAIACWESNEFLPNEILLWDIEQGRIVRNMGLRDRSRFLVFSSDGRSLASLGDRTTVRDVKTGDVRFQVSAAQTAAFSPDSTLLVTSTTRTFKLWDARSGTLLAHNNEAHQDGTEFNPYCFGVAFTQMGKRSSRPAWTSE